MSHTISLQVPDELFDEIETKARQHGQDPSNLILMLVEESLRQQADIAHAGSYLRPQVSGYDPSKDPLAEFIGIFASEEGDLAERHDEYLAEEYRKTHDDE